ncbi:MAG: oxidoreductase [Patescibacteria group bacterium]|nr:oxidoreductase [Patescibacteria group bacterium]
MEETNKVEQNESGAPKHDEDCECGSDCNCESDNKKIKNLTSVAILLAGLFIGSLFVDVAQLIKGSGYSAKNLNKSDVFEADGKTWVAYSEPAVSVKIINDDACEKCDVSEVLVWMRRVLPTVAAEKVAFDSEEGKMLEEKFGLKSLPAFVFSDDIAKTDFYAQAQPLFEEKDGKFVLKTQELGIPTGKYLAVPEIREGDAVFGNKDAKAKIVVFSDFQCPYCKVFYKSLRDVMNQYSEKAQFAFKEFPLDSIHPQANGAALAAACAQEQGKFWEYADILYDKQNDWSKATNTSLFKTYAGNLRLETGKFNECLDGKKYQAKIDADKKEAADFGISGTPAIFAGENFESGAVDADKLKEMVEKELAE